MRRRVLARVAGNVALLTFFVVLFVWCLRSDPPWRQCDPLSALPWLACPR